MATEQWFEPGKPLGWKKSDTQAKRRRVALRNRKGDYLTTARALQSLSNVTQDKETERKARSDAKYFFRKYRNKRR
jgi:hypothetical protein